MSNLNDFLTYVKFEHRDKDFKKGSLQLVSEPNPAILKI